MKPKLFLKLLPILPALLLISCEKAQTESYGAITLTSISPAEGYTNDLVTIIGKNFDPVAENNIVRFGDHVATVKSATPTELKVLAPSGTGEVNVTVTTDQGTSDGLLFKYLVAEIIITSIIPDIGIEGDIVTINGKNFNENIHNNLVLFNDVVAEVKTATTTQLEVVVPEGRSTVNVTVSVGKSKSTSLPFSYTVNKTTVIGISPASAFAGDEVTISGTFKTPTDENIVMFGDEQAQIMESSDSELRVIVPPGSGIVDVVVSSANDASEPWSFQYATIRLTKLSADQAQACDTLIISGDGFDPAIANNKVYFGQNIGEVISATANELRVVVPQFSDDNADVDVSAIVNDGTSNVLPFHLLRYYTDIVAGCGVQGSSTETVAASEAQFDQPVNLTFDSSGNLYIAESGGGTVRRLTPDGKVEFIAGRHRSYGAADGTGAEATFKYPYDLAIGGDGNIYVADVTNHLIRKITPDGTVTTVAGVLNSSSAADGKGTEATFREPYSIVTDNDGNLLVGDKFAVRKITLPDYVVTTVAGDDLNATNAGSVSSFNSVRGLDVASDGTIYVCDCLNNCIKKINPDGTVVRICGPEDRTQIGHVDGPASEALFYNPQGLKLAADGCLFVSDGTQNKNYYLRKIQPNGYVTTVLGNGDTTPFVESGLGTTVPFKGWGVTIDKDGTIYIPDQQHLYIRKLYLK